MRRQPDWFYALSPERVPKEIEEALGKLTNKLTKDLTFKAFYTLEQKTHPLVFKKALKVLEVSEVEIQMIRALMEFVIDKTTHLRTSGITPNGIFDEGLNFQENEIVFKKDENKTLYYFQEVFYDHRLKGLKPGELETLKPFLAKIKAQRKLDKLLLLRDCKTLKPYLAMQNELTRWEPSK